MSKADEALADVRRWLCDSLSDGDAGKVCGMLSVVSRRIAEIDEENAALRTQLADVTESMGRVEERCAMLRELVRDMVEWAYIDSSCDLQEQFADRMRELGVEL